MFKHESAMSTGAGVSVKPAVDDSDHRIRWRENRARKEWAYQHCRRYLLKRLIKWGLMKKIERSMERGMKWTGVYPRGLQNALRVVVRPMTIEFPDLPGTFDPYSILHVSDPHLDGLSGIEDAVATAVKGLKIDLCVFTGDYQHGMFGSEEQILPSLKRIFDGIEARDGILAVLGNHDTYLLVDRLEAIGATVLVNESVSIRRGGDAITFTGLDDPHEYYTDQAEDAICEKLDGFKIGLIHSPELFRLAAENGYRLYLCGHTHGGQICLPGAIPILTHLHRGRRFCRGLWRYRSMVGYTSQGCGVVGIRARYNSESEVALITMRRRSNT